MSPGRFAALGLVALFTNAGRADARPAPPLIEAVKQRQRAMIKRLLDAGANAKAVSVEKLGDSTGKLELGSVV